MVEHYAIIHVYKEDSYWVAKNTELNILTSHPDRMTAVTDIMKCTEAQPIYKETLRIESKYPESRFSDDL